MIEIDIFEYLIAKFRCFFLLLSGMATSFIDKKFFGK